MRFYHSKRVKRAEIIIGNQKKSHHHYIKFGKGIDKTMNQICSIPTIYIACAQIEIEVNFLFGVKNYSKVADNMV